MSRANQGNAENSEIQELAIKESQQERREARFVAISYLTGFIAFMTALIPGVTVLFGRNLDYFNLGFLASGTAFVLSMVIALGGVACAKFAKESLSGTLNILAVAFNLFLLCASFVEGFFTVWFGFIILCAAAGITFIIIAIPTLKGVRPWIKELSHKTRKPVDTVRLWGHGILIAMVFMGIAAFLILLLDNL